MSLLLYGFYSHQLIDLYRHFVFQITPHFVFSEVLGIAMQYTKHQQMNLPNGHHQHYNLSIHKILRGTFFFTLS